MVYILYRENANGSREPVGFYDSLPEAVGAYAEERMKEDGVLYRIESEEDGKDEAD